VAAAGGDIEDADAGDFVAAFNQPEMSRSLPSA